MPLIGSIRVPSDKSISHRSVLLAGLSEGASKLSAVLPSADVHASLGAIRALGAQVDIARGANGLSGEIRGIGQNPRVSGPLEIDCGNSGTTARLLLGILSGLNVEARIIGDESLSTRPMERVMEPLRELGARFDAASGHLPLRILTHAGLNGRDLKTKQASAQVKSAILLAGLAANGTTSVTEPQASRNHTELMLPAFGVPVQVEGLKASVTGPARLSACDVSIPADPSSAAFVAVAAALMPGSDVIIERVALNDTRIGAFKVIERMGCPLKYENLAHIGAEPVGDVRVKSAAHLNSTVVHPAEIPSLIDEIPILALAAACAHGETVFESCGELRVKESDRFAAIIDGLAAFGIEAFADADDLHIIGAAGVPKAGASAVSLPTYHDHRLAMTWYIAGLCMRREVTLDDADCVAVSWPDFFEDIAALIT